MQVFKRSKFLLVKGLVLAPLTAVVVYFAAYIFTEDPRIQYGLAGAAFLFLVYIAIFSENVRFEVTDQGEFRYFKRGKLKAELTLREYQVGYHRRSERGLLGDHTIHLQVVSTLTGTEEQIDCSPIGLGQFERMYALLETHTAGEPEVLRATPAE